MDFNQLMMKMRDLDQPVADAAPVEACGDMPPMGMPSMPPKADEPPPSMSVNLNAQGLDNIEELMKLIMKVNPDMDKPDMPSLPSMGMEPSIASIKSSLPPLKMLPDLDKEDDHPEPDADNFGGPSDDDADNKPTGKMDIIKIGDEEGDDKKKDKEEEFANEPDTDYKDADYMNNKLAGGMNRPKDTFPKVADGDNPMQKKQFEGSDLRAQIRAELLQRLAEAKGAK